MSFTVNWQQCKKALFHNNSKVASVTPVRKPKTLYYTFAQSVFLISFLKVCENILKKELVEKMNNVLRIEKRIENCTTHNMYLDLLKNGKET